MSIQEIHSISIQELDTVIISTTAMTIGLAVTRVAVMLAPVVIGTVAILALVIMDSVVTRIAVMLAPVVTRVAVMLAPMVIGTVAMLALVIMDLVDTKIGAIIKSLN